MYLGDNSNTGDKHISFEGTTLAARKFADLQKILQTDVRDKTIHCSYIWWF